MGERGFLVRFQVAIRDGCPREIMCDLLNIITAFALPECNVPLSQVDISIGAIVDVRQYEHKNRDYWNGFDGGWIPGVIVGHSDMEGWPNDGWSWSGWKPGTCPPGFDFNCTNEMLVIPDKHKRKRKRKRTTLRLPRWVFVKPFFSSSHWARWFPTTETPFHIQPFGWITQGHCNPKTIYRKDDFVVIWNRNLRRWDAGQVTATSKDADFQTLCTTYEIYGVQWRVRDYTGRCAVYYGNEIAPAPIGLLVAKNYSGLVNRMELSSPTTLINLPPPSEAALELIVEHPSQLLDKYQILGLPFTATQAEIHAAYQHANKENVHVLNAFETLSDPKKRQDYDQFDRKGWWPSHTGFSLPDSNTDVDPEDEAQEPWPDDPDTDQD
jgi:hypothetical protein